MSEFDMCAASLFNECKRHFNMFVDPSKSCEIGTFAFRLAIATEAKNFKCNEQYYRKLLDFLDSLGYVHNRESLPSPDDPNTLRSYLVMDDERRIVLDPRTAFTEAISIIITH
jgi:hypothetical protein